MPSEPFWLPGEFVVHLNRHTVGITGEPHAIRDQGLLESACARPRNLFAYEGQEDVATLATALLFGIARNHPFVQGNKRTGFAAAIAFLEANGYDVVLDDTETVASQVISVVDGTSAEDDFARVLRSSVRRD